MSLVPDPATAHKFHAAKCTAKIELHLSCIGLKNLDYLSKSDPFVIIYAKDALSTQESTARREQSTWREIKRTETIWDNLNPEFPDHIVLDYHFELVQDLRFDVYDRDSESEDLKAHDFIGSVYTTLSRIMGSRGATFSAELRLPGQTRSRGKLIIKGEEVSSNKDILYMQLSARDLERKNWFGFGKSDPFYSIFRSREDGSFVKVFESETIKSELNPTWKPIQIPLQRVCNGDLDRPIRISVYDWEYSGDHKLIGEVTSSVRHLTTGKSLELVNPVAKQKKGFKHKASGILKMTHVEIETRHSFLEYIRGGCELNLIVAIDFTASNGAPSLPTSLHFQSKKNFDLDGSFRNFNDLNEYQRAILSIGEILKDYDSDNKFPLYGFGGATNGVTNHCFPLTFDPDHPEVNGVQGIMNAYKNAFNFVSLSGPTLFSRVIALASQYASSHCSQAEQTYSVLLILTDGVINDMDQTIEQIVHASKLPLSIIIVGVGKANFENMEILDADDNPLSYNGETMARDIVQFVPFRDFKDQHIQALAAETLAELPDQVVSYFALRKIKPNRPTLASSRHLAIERSQRSLGAAISSSEQDNASLSRTTKAPSAPPADGTIL